MMGGQVNGAWAPNTSCSIDAFGSSCWPWVRVVVQLVHGRPSDSGVRAWVGVVGWSSRSLRYWTSRSVYTQKHLTPTVSRSLVV